MPGFSVVDQRRVSKSVDVYCCILFNASWCLWCLLKIPFGFKFSQFGWFMSQSVIVFFLGWLVHGQSQIPIELTVRLWRKSWILSFWCRGYSLIPCKQLKLWAVNIDDIIYIYTLHINYSYIPHLPRFQFLALKHLKQRHAMSTHWGCFWWSLKSPPSPAMVIFPRITLWLFQIATRWCHPQL
jgi:hypothetical protein